MSAFLVTALALSLLAEPPYSPPADVAAAEAVDLDLLVVPSPEPAQKRTPDVDIRRHLRPGGSILDARSDLDRHLEDTLARRAVLEVLRGRVEAELTARRAAALAGDEALDELRADVQDKLWMLERAERGGALGAIAGKWPPEGPSWRGLNERVTLAHWVRLRVMGRIHAYAAIRALWEGTRIDLDRRTRNLRHLERAIAVLDQEAAWDREEREALSSAVVEQPEFYAAYVRDMEKVDEALGAFVRELLASAPSRPRLFFEDNRDRVVSPIRNGTQEEHYGTRTHLGVKALWRGAHWSAPAKGVRGEDPRAVKTVYWGYVLWTGWFKGLGRTVIVDHTQGWVSVYAHLSAIDAEVGAKIPTGTRIGLVGDTESFFGHRLYFQLREDGEPRRPF